MDMYGLADALDVPVIVHRCHGLVDQIIAIGRQDVKSENLAGLGVDDCF